ncbi:thymidine kinase [Candidatus Marinimicrobia bacterium]|nr:thymidine kinase [Candidatus Neomarinimicrobiota bacterium]MDC0383318.1 thymidine kinase [Candidatus Neomarinimicrobiota bacterium]MDC0631091.1 thymidine kinase [Candidatus Neomarinimicrobiota bacterium]
MKKVINLRNQNSGSIEVICGGMFSGKTEELIRRLRRAEIAKLSVVIFKPQLDSRFKKEHIVSHNRREMKSILIEDPKQILKMAISYEVVGIDEAQFFDNKITEVCQKLAKDYKRVIVAGLDKDYRGNPFGPMPHLMAEADYLDKLRAICTKCGSTASNSQRMTQDLEKIVLGELDKYEPRCRGCFIEPIKNK